MKIRKIIANLSALLLATFAIMSFAAVAANASTAAPAAQEKTMGVTSSGRVFNLSRPPSWLKPNTLVHPLNYISPDRLEGNFQICYLPTSQCINNWDNGGAGTRLRFYSEGVANNDWNWWYEGTVDASKTWPFTPGSQVNSQYNTNPVYKFAGAPNGHGTGHCMSQGLFSGNYSGLVTANCVAGNAQTDPNSLYQYFVIDGYGRLVAVAATNTQVAATGNIYDHVWVGDQNNNNGNGAYVVLVTDISDALRFTQIS